MSPSAKVVPEAERSETQTTCCNSPLAVPRDHGELAAQSSDGSICFSSVRSVV